MNHIISLIPSAVLILSSLVLMTIYRLSESIAERIASAILAIACAVMAILLAMTTPASAQGVQDAAEVAAIHTAIGLGLDALGLPHAPRSELSIMPDPEPRNIFGDKRGVYCAHGANTTWIGDARLTIPVAKVHENAYINVGWHHQSCLTADDIRRENQFFVGTTIIWDFIK